jgi:cysteine desulfurase
VAREALLAALADGWADPGRIHAAGRRAHQLLAAARAATAAVLGARPDEVTFCASGTEAALLALRGTLTAAAQRPGTPGWPIIVHSAVEHSAVLAAVAEATGTQRAGPAIAVGVDRMGRIDLDAFAAAVRTPGVALAALISASHEVGTTQPVAAAARLCTEAGVPLYVDAAQSFGRVPVPPGWSLLTGSARKWGGPAGVGVLVVRRGTRWLPPADQGRAAGLAAGEERLNLPAVVAAAAALRAAAAEATAEAARQYGLVDKIRRTLVATVPDVEVVGDPVERLPHLVTFSCLYVEGEALSRELDRRGFAVSSGSACTTASGQPSHVLAAMGVLTQGNVRVSLHPGVTAADLDRFLAAVPEVVARLRAEAGVLDLVSEL